MSRAIILIHGYLTDVRDFGRLYDYLPFYDEVRAVKIPGHNDGASYDEFNVPDTFYAVIDAYNELHGKYDSVDVLGFSMGGALACWLAARCNVDKVVLLSPANKYLNFQMPINTFKYYGKFVRDYRAADGDIKDKLAAVREGMHPYKENVSTSLKILRHTGRHVTPHTYGVFRRIIQIANDMLDKKDSLPNPALVLWGQLDELVPYKSIEYVLSKFVNARKVVFDEVGHAMLYTNFDHLIIREIVSFLSDGAYVPDVPPHESEAPCYPADNHRRLKADGAEPIEGNKGLDGGKSEE